MLTTKEIHAVRSLGAAVLLQAVRDYCDCTPKWQKAILKDLRSKWMDFLTEGKSIVVAEQLEKHPEEIAQRLKKELRK